MVKCVRHQGGAGRPWKKSSVEALPLPSSCREAFLSTVPCIVPCDVQVAAELRARVVEATRGLTCSVGVAPNMMLAKIASDRNKPNGQCVVGPTREEVLQFISDLPIRKVGLSSCAPHDDVCVSCVAWGGLSGWLWRAQGRHRRAPRAASLPSRC